MIVIDADAHVIETEKTWDYLEPSERKYKPVLVDSQDGPKRQVWLIDGVEAGLRPPSLTQQELEELSRRAGRKMTTPQEAREMLNVDMRLRHMDECGIDVEVLHNTIFLLHITDNPAAEAALSWAWDRWMADISRQGNGRLRWSCVVSTRSIPDALEQMRFSKEHGACAVFVRPLEGDRLMVDPYFYPIYEEASRLDLSIAVHISNGNPWLFKLTTTGLPGGLLRFRGVTVMAAYDLLLSEVPQLFPALRFGFIESSAQWVPWVLVEAEKRLRSRSGARPDVNSLMESNRVYVTCENADDLPYILSYGMAKSLVIGTDYGHIDSSSELDAIQIFRERTDIAADLKQLILHDNPRKLYAL
jgi:predicted TIM-barrel fold metal-dependent hydrolase